MSPEENKSISILIIAPYSNNPIGGQAKFATELGSKLSEKYRVFYLSPPDKLKISKYTRPFYSILLFIKLPLLIFVHKIDIIHIFSPCSRLALFEKLLIAVFSKILKTKVIFNFRDSIEINYTKYSKTEWHIVIYLLNKLDVVLSQYKKQNKFLENEGVASDKLNHIYNGISIDELKTFKIDSKSYIDILFIGEIGNRKGVDLILKSVYVLQKDNELKKKFKVSIYGYDTISGYINECNMFINKNRLNNYIEIYPPIIGDIKYNRLAQCDIFLLPSNSEGFPNVVLEAMLYSRALITSNVGALDEVIEDGVHGIKILPDDLNSLVNNLKLLINDDIKRTYLGTNAKDLIVSKYLISDIHKEYSNLYNRIN